MGTEDVAEKCVALLVGVEEQMLFDLAECYARDEGGVGQKLAQFDLVVGDGRREFGGGRGRRRLRLGLGWRLELVLGGNRLLAYLYHTGSKDINIMGV